MAILSYFLRFMVLFGPAFLPLSMVAANDEQKITTQFDTETKVDVSDVGSFAPSATLLGKTLHDEAGVPVGRIDDIVIDPYTGMTTTLLIRPSSKDRLSRRMLIPMQLVTPIRQLMLRARADKDKIEIGPSIGDEVHPYRRQLARVPFAYYGLEPPWADSQQNREHKLKDDDLFVFVRTIRRSPVWDTEKRKIGQLEDFAISWDNGKIAYALITKTTDVLVKKSDKADNIERYAIPLGAFVAKPKWKSWVIENPDNLLEKTNAIDKGKWPSKVSLRWSHYVQHRYGESMLSGVQREFKLRIVTD